MYYIYYLYIYISIYLFKEVPEFVEWAFLGELFGGRGWVFDTAEAGLELLDLDDPLASASQATGIHPFC